MDFLFGAPPRMGGFHVKNHHFLKMWKFLTENTTRISLNQWKRGQYPYGFDEKNIHIIEKKFHIVKIRNVLKNLIWFA